MLTPTLRKPKGNQLFQLHPLKNLRNICDFGLSSTMEPHGPLRNARGPHKGHGPCQQGSMGPHRASLEPIGPQWAQAGASSSTSNHYSTQALLGACFQEGPTFIRGPLIALASFHIRVQLVVFGGPRHEKKKLRQQNLHPQAPAERPRRRLGPTRKNKLGCPSCARWGTMGGSWWLLCCLMVAP